VICCERKGVFSGLKLNGRDGGERYVELGHDIVFSNYEGASMELLCACTRRWMDGPV